MFYRRNDISRLFAWVFGWLLLISGAQTEGVVTQETCLRETFSAECPSGQVVLMEQARYGRMKLGRCVKRDFGYMEGCAADVLTMADRACSGRQRCTIDVFKTFGELRPCSELESFLLVSYSCIPVSQGAIEDCAADGWFKVRETEGFIPNALIDPYRHGRKSCPFRLSGSPWQRWNITLMDFGIASVTGMEGMSADARTPVCQRYAEIKEDDGKGSKTAICGGEVREKTVYISESHKVQIKIFTIHDSTKAHFLLKYQAVGCPKPDLPVGAIIRRDKNAAEVTCNGTGTTWKLKCEGDKWIGKTGTCGQVIQSSQDTSVTSLFTTGVNWSIWDVLTNDWTTPYGILLVTALGVALGVIIGAILLTIAIVCYKRKRKLDEPHETAYTCSPGDIDIDISNQDTLKHGRLHYTDSLDTRRAPLKPGDYGSYKYQRGGGPSELCKPEEGLTVCDYGTRTSRNLPPPPYAESTSGYGTSRVSLNTEYSEHLYEIPN